MSKSRRRMLEKSSSAPADKINYIDPKVTRQLPLVFGFKNLDFDKKPFECSAGDGAGMLYVLKTLQLFSKTNRTQIDTGYGNCHVVPDDQVRRHNLLSFLGMAPNNKLHQLGRYGTPQRVVGYYEDSPRLNEFQVCLLDLRHELSGD